ncbi:sulfurtransferase complex subunit TusB [Balneatrix alpica]|uniref:Sulfurtransferase complex subunit TusB n=1 Tax=Balneatrix alpica TaxID=75684 RepID=A0ABV5Z6K2_9GAMM|nr:sulfurtransferase complex subunit TusB [Balneatrix alpica]
MLHLIPLSPWQQDLQAILHRCQAGDALVFLQDGSYVLQQHPLPTDATGISLYVLSEDAQARGLNVQPPFQALDYDGLVDLTAAHSQSLTWY